MDTAGTVIFVLPDQISICICWEFRRTKYPLFKNTEFNIVLKVRGMLGSFILVSERNVYLSSFVLCSSVCWSVLDITRLE